MKVFILAAGYGMRIRAKFPDIPKALVPIREKPFIEHQINLLKEQGFKDFILCVGYRSQQIKEYCGDGSKWGVSIRYSEEEEPQGTGTTLRIALSLLSSAALVINGDTYFSADYKRLAAAHTQEAAKRQTLATIGLVSMPKHEGSGCVMLDPHNRIVEFMEKASDQGEGFVNAGAYIVEQAIRGVIPEGSASLELDVFPKLAHDGLLFGVPLNGRFIDMGTPAGHSALEASL